MPGATSYRAEAGISPTQVLGAYELGALTSFSITAPQGTYYIRVFARNAQGLSAPSNIVGVTVTSALAPPPPPSGLVASVSRHHRQLLGAVCPAGHQPAWSWPPAWRPARRWPSFRCPWPPRPRCQTSRRGPTSPACTRSGLAAPAIRPTRCKSRSAEVAPACRQARRRCRPRPAAPRSASPGVPWRVRPAIRSSPRCRRAGRRFTPSRSPPAPRAWPTRVFRPAPTTCG